MKMHFQVDSGNPISRLGEREEEMLINDKESIPLKSTDNKNH